MMTRLDPTIFDELRSHALKGTVLVPMLQERSGATHADGTIFTRTLAAVRRFAARWSTHLVRPRPRLIGATRP